MLSCSGSLALGQVIAGVCTNQDLTPKILEPEFLVLRSWF